VTEGRTPAPGGDGRRFAALSGAEGAREPEAGARLSAFREGGASARSCDDGASEPSSADRVPARTAAAATREERLAKALRANLRRRKQQLRSRGDAPAS